WVDLLDDRQAERSRLTRPGLGLGNDVLTIEQCRNRGDLDRLWRLVPDILQRPLNRRTQREISTRYRQLVFNTACRSGLRLTRLGITIVTLTLALRLGWLGSGVGFDLSRLLYRGFSLGGHNGLSRFDFNSLGGRLDSLLRRFDWLGSSFDFSFSDR